jgi:hypothetical protein
MNKAKAEIVRRLRLGDLRKLLRSRYGHTLPDDDAGREDLHELLLPISLGPQAALKMRNAIEVHAPWLNHDEAGQLIDRIMRTPTQLRKPKARQAGQRHRVTNHERELFRLWTIAPCDMTDEQMHEHRKAKKRARDRHRRRMAGSKPRETSLARTKPWEAEGISRKTWFRRRPKGRDTNSRQLKLRSAERELVSPEKLKGRKRLSNGRRLH